MERQRLVQQLLPPDAPGVDLENDRLFALLDGLAAHAAMRPKQATAQRLIAVLNAHLDRITGP